MLPIVTRLAVRADHLLRARLISRPKTGLVCAVAVADSAIVAYGILIAKEGWPLAARWFVHVGCLFALFLTTAAKAAHGAFGAGDRRHRRTAFAAH